MTPFGERVRDLRAARGVTLKAMARDLDISSAYLSALEHGRRGRPSAMLVRQICAFFGLIWDEAEEMERLARLSDPRVVVDTAGLPADRTLVANLLAQRIARLADEETERLLRILGEDPKPLALGQDAAI